MAEIPVTVEKSLQSAGTAEPDPKRPVLTELQQQLLDAHIHLRRDLKTHQAGEHQGLYVIVEDPVRNKFYSVGSNEFRFLSSLVAERPVKEVVADWRGREQLNPSSAAAICEWAVQANLVVCDQMDSTHRLERQAQQLDRQKWLSLFNPIAIKLKLFNPNRLLRRLTPYCHWFFSKSALLVWLTLAVWAISTGITDWERLSQASVGILSGYRWLWLILIWMVLKVVHELAHGLACRKYGGDVHEAGVLFMLFTPMAYVNVTSSWRFQSRWQRMVVAGAGMYVELFLSFVALIVWTRLSSGILSDLCYNIILMSSVTTVLFNANPLMRFDGYYILSDGLGINNLYSKGTRLFSDWLRSVFFGVPKTPNICSAAEFWPVAVYGTLAFVWKILISVGLVIGASVLFYGLGKIIAIGCITFYFGLPIWSQMKQLYGPNAALRPSHRRLAISGALVAFAIISLFVAVRAPAVKSAPAIVQFKDETPIRAQVDGFIHEIRVADGQPVTRGQTMLVLRNRQIELDVIELEKNADSARIRAKMHQQSQALALQQAEDDRLAGILKQLSEKRQQCESLVVTAPFDGFVLQRGLDSQLGSFAKQGSTLLVLAQAKTKQVAVVIEQRDWESLKNKNGHSMRVAIKSLPVFSASISRIDGRASDIPKYPSLSVDFGGSLPVKLFNSGSNDSDRETENRLLSPHFIVDLAVTADIGERLQSGQRGRAFFETDRQSLGTFLFVAVEEWLKHKIEMAMQSAAF